jgi:hypothetical protein
VGVFALACVPLLFGATAVAHAVPWAGLVAGIALALTGLVVAVGGHVSIPIAPRWRLRGGGALTLVTCGAAYGFASLGCGLPIFLALVAATLSTSGTGPALVVFAAYAAGMTLMLVTLAIAAGLVRDGLGRRLGWLLPRIGRASGVLLLLAGSYLVYFWGRIRWGSTATLADDPVVGLATRYSARVQTLASGIGSELVIAAGAASAGALALSTWHWRHRQTTAVPHLDPRPGGDAP